MNFNAVAPGAMVKLLSMADSGFSYEKTNAYLVEVTCNFWLIAKLITWKLWLASRSFPLVPLFNSLAHIPVVAHYLLLFVSLTCLFSLLFQPGQKTLLAVLFVSEMLSCLCDQNRWQPWEYQYLFIMLTVFLGRNKPENVPSATAFILAATYFYSGMHKLNNAFLNSIWDSTMLIRFFKLPASVAQGQIMHNLGYAIGLIEATAGLALFHNRTKKAAAILL